MDSAQRGQNVQMTDTIWRQLMMLIHPDKHIGGESEAMANEMTRWLLEQRPRLSKTRKAVR
jgi:hypothetical protein